MSPMRWDGIWVIAALLVWITVHGQAPQDQRGSDGFGLLSAQPPPLLAAAPASPAAARSNAAAPGIDVRAFGAACDGKTDDTASIQAAVNAVPPAGGTVVVSGGTCVLTAPVSLKPNVELVGLGAAGQSALRQTRNVPAVEFDNACCAPVGPVTVRNLKIVTGSGSAAHGLDFHNVFLVLLDKVFVNAGNLTNASTTGGDGIRFVRVTNSSIVNSTVGSGNRVGIYLERSYNVIVANSLITENLSDGIQGVKSTYLTFTGNAVTENHGHGISIGDGGGFFGPGQQGVAVAGNVIRANGKALFGAAPTDGAGVRYWKTAGTISGNIINFNFGHGVDLQNTSNVVVVGNAISANGQRKGEARNGIALEARRGETASGNLLVGNRIYDDQPAKTQAYAVEEFGPGALGPNVIEGNDVRGNAQPSAIAVKGVEPTALHTLGSAPLTFGPVPPHAARERTVIIPGAAMGSVVVCSPSESIGDPFVWTSRIASPRHAVVRVANIGETAATPRVVPWQCQVLRQP